MNPNIAKILLLSSIGLCARHATAQSYSIDWHTMDGGGGGSSTGGVYSMSGIMGQSDAGTMSGGNYTLESGSWGITAVVQTPGAPLLTISFTGTDTVMVAWPFPSAGFELQQTTDLKTSNWTLPSESVTDNGATRFISVSPMSGSRFYRLFKP